jgi:nicotinamide mononucleotide (NMN) deamidase PncC
MITKLTSSEIFQMHRGALQGQVEQELTILTADSWDYMLQAADNDLRSWQEITGREQNYDPESLARAIFARNAANEYQEANRFDLILGDSIHQAELSEHILSSGLANRLIAEGKKSNKLGIVELSARLLPILTFPGSSSYLELGVVPYGKNSRAVLGEAPAKNFVTAGVAAESARNLFGTFGVHYALAETSAAPRLTVPKSAKKPEIYLCGVIDGKVAVQENHTIETPFRSEFNAKARQFMYDALWKMLK